MHIHHDHAAGGADIKEEDRTICPVMHIPVSKHEAEANDLVRTFNDKKYYMCCDACIASFEQNPEQYTQSHQEGAHE